MQHSEWEKFRSHAWKVIEPHIDPRKVGGLTKFDWMPVPGDPTKAEIKELRIVQAEQDHEEVKRIYNERLKQAQRAGLTHKTA
jgi:hypothetical protein